MLVLVLVLVVHRSTRRDSIFDFGLVGVTSVGQGGLSIAERQGLSLWAGAVSPASAYRSAVDAAPTATWESRESNCKSSVGI